MILPNNLPAYKDSNSIITSEHRLSMLELAIADEPKLFVSDMELLRGGTTYTIDTLEQIHHINPNLEIAFIIGADSLLSFIKWYRYKDILKHCTLLVVGRDSNRAYLKTFARQLISDVGYGSIKILRNKNMEISSSDIRNSLAMGEIPYDSIPLSVANYIKINKLYRIG